MFKYENFNVLSCHTQSASQNIYDDIEEVKILSKSIYDQVKTEADCQIGLDVLQMLVVDVLGRDSISAQIFDSKVKYDFRRKFVVKLLAKGLTCLALIVFNIVVAVLTARLTADRSNEWQQAFIAACFVQLALEGIFTTNDCILWHYTLPAYISEELQASVRTIMEGIDHALLHTELWKEKRRVVPILETTSYLFVSRQIAAKFPHIFECSIVLSFMSMFPRGRLAQHFKPTDFVLKDTYTSWIDQVYSKVNLSVGMSHLVNVLGPQPVYVQMIALRSIQPLLLFFCLVVFVAITEQLIFIVVPFLTILYLVVADRKRKRIAKQPQILPLMFHSSEVQEDNDSESDSEHGADTSATEGNKDELLLPKPDSASKSNDAQAHWRSIQSSVVSSQKPSAMKMLVGQAHAHEVAVKQYNAEGGERTAASLVSTVEDRTVNRIASLISESSGLPMEEARAIARKEIEQQFEMVRLNKLHGGLDKDVEKKALKPTESMSYIDMTLSRAASSRALHSTSGAASWSQLRSYDSGVLMTKSPTMASVVKQQQWREGGESAPSGRSSRPGPGPGLGGATPPVSATMASSPRRVNTGAGSGTPQHSYSGLVLSEWDNNDDEDDTSGLIRKASPTTATHQLYS
jgi:hypothetical protein